MITVYSLSSVVKIRLQQEGLWESVPSNVKQQWSQRFYNNKSAVRVVTKSDPEIREWVEKYVNKVQGGWDNTTRTSAEEFLSRTEK